MQTKQFRIGELSKKLCVEKFVIRFWEKEFNIKPQRSTGQQRFYTEKDLKKFSAIKELLYQKGFTIAGAKKLLGSRSEQLGVLSATKTTLAELCPDKATLQADLKKLRAQLIKLRELL
jgi:DNA-binding transcriptional MerR regulator